MSTIGIIDGIAVNYNGCLFAPDLSPCQEEVFELLKDIVSRERITILTGSPGSGKTTILPHVQNHFRQLGRKATWVSMEAYSRKHAESPDAAKRIIADRIAEAFWDFDAVVILTGTQSAVSGQQSIELVAEQLARYESGTKAVVLEVIEAPSLDQFVGRMLPGAVIQRMIAPTAEDYRHVLTVAFGQNNVGDIDCQAFFDHRNKASMTELADIAAAAIICGQPKPDTALLVKFIRRIWQVKGICEQLADIHKGRSDVVQLAKTPATEGRSARQ